MRELITGHWTVTDGGRSLAAGARPEGLVPAIKQLIRQIAVNRHPALISIHAGVVSLGEACVLLPAIAGSGKTTLTAGLVHAGATYFSDEIALLDADTLLATPVPLALTITHGAVAPLRGKYTELDRLPGHVREDGVRVRYLPPPAGSLPRLESRLPVRWVVFPHYAPSCITALSPIDRPTGLRRLLEEAQVERLKLDRVQAGSIVQWMRTVDCFDLRMSSLDDAIFLVQELAGQQVLKSN